MSENSTYKVVISLQKVGPFQRKMKSILLREYGFANEKVPAEGSAHHKKDGIWFQCRGMGGDFKNPGKCTMTGPLSKRTKIDEYVSEATAEYPVKLGKPEVERFVYSKIE